MKIKDRPEDFLVTEIPLLEPLSSGKYGYFSLRKKNYTTSRAVGAIARSLRVSRSHVGYAGSKDAKAITKQFITIKSRHKSLSLKDIELEHIGFLNEPISLGDLKGNTFEIVVRDIEHPPKKTDQAVNYFDEQRFSRNNLQVGLAILKKEFGRAARLIQHASVQKYLEKTPTDPVGAIRTLPFRVLKLYLHAVQSWLWNEVAALYVKEHYKTFEVPYSEGVFAFTAEDLDQMELPLFTFDTVLPKRVKQFYEEKLNELNLDRKHFVIRQLPQASPKGSNRLLISPINALDISPLQQDEKYGKKKVKVAFSLGKGCYATIALKKMFSRKS